MRFISSIFGGKTAHEVPAETRRKDKPRNKSSKPNKLSKPRTNTSTNNLLVVSAGDVSKKTSLVERSSSVPVRTDAQLALGEDAGLDAEWGRGRPKENEKRASRLSGLFRSKSSTPSTTTVSQERPDDKWSSDVNGGAGTLRASELLHRYSHLAPPSYSQELLPESQLGMTDKTPNLHQPSTYTTYHQTRLSLVAEAPSPAPTPDPQHLQRLAETEAILTGGASIRSKSSNASNRHSILSGMSPVIPVRTGSSEYMYVQAGNNTPYPIRRRSNLTPGDATRVEEVKKPKRSSKVLQKTNPRTRRQSVAATEADQPFVNKFEKSQPLFSEEEINNYYYDQSKPSESPLASLERLAPFHKPRFRENSIEMKRMSTPTDLRHIGSYELGSLRIMNGAATSSAGNTPKARKTPAADSEIDSSYLQKEIMSPVSTIRMQSNDQGGIIDVNQTRQLEIKIDPAEPGIEPPSRSASTITRQSVYSDKPTISREPSQRLDTAPQVPGGSEDLADFYRLDIDILPDPFSTDTPTPSLPQLETTSKHTAEQDELFEDIMNTVKSGSPGLEPPSYLSEASGGQNDELYLPIVEPAFQHRHARASNTPTPADLGMLAAIDSGYNSYTSLGSVKSSGSQSRLRDSSESPTQSSIPDSAPSDEIGVALKPSKSIHPKADYWKTQHAPSTITREYKIIAASAREESALPPPLRAAPRRPPRSQIQISPIPTTVALTDNSETQPEVEASEAAEVTHDSASATPPKRPSFFQHRSTNNVLQKSPRRRQNSDMSHSRSSSVDTITPTQMKWQKNSTELGLLVNSTAQDMNEVPPIPKRLSLTFGARASKFYSSKHVISTSASDGVEPAVEKPCAPLATEKMQPSIRRQSSPVILNPTAITFTEPKQLPTNSTRTSPTASITVDKEHRSRKHSVKDLTQANAFAKSPGSSPYDEGASATAPTQKRASNQPSIPAGNQNLSHPRRDRTGRIIGDRTSRIIGMDEESASNFGRARSQVRAQEAEKREILMSRAARSPSSSQNGRAPASVSNSNLSAISNASENIPPIPTINLPDAERQNPMRGKREKTRPPPSMLNPRNRMSGVLGFWGGPGADVDARQDVSNRTVPMGPPGFVLPGEVPSLASLQKVGFSVANLTGNLPSMAPQWKGPSPKELAAMALAARKEGRTSVDAQRRSTSVHGGHDKRGGDSRPSSVISERDGGKRRRWSLIGRREIEV